MGSWALTPPPDPKFPSSHTLVWSTSYDTCVSEEQDTGIWL